MLTKKRATATKKESDSSKYSSKDSSKEESTRQGTYLPLDELVQALHRLELCIAVE